MSQGPLWVCSDPEQTADDFITFKIIGTSTDGWYVFLDKVFSGPFYDDLPNSSWLESVLLYPA